MKKSLLFSLLTVCTINSALAENIQSIDTPVNWSYSAIFNTIFDLYKDDEASYDAGYYAAERLYYLYYDTNQAVSARWICENYNTIAREEGLLVHNCSNVITKLINNHNQSIKLGTQLKPIDILNPENDVYWNPASVTYACQQAADEYQEAVTTIVVQSGQDEGFATKLGRYQANKAFKRCRDLKYSRELYHKPYSINYLLGYCKGYVFEPVWGYKYDPICSKWIDYAIEHHNKSIRQTENISGTIK